MSKYSVPQQLSGLRQLQHNCMHYCKYILLSGYLLCRYLSSCIFLCCLISFIFEIVACPNTGTILGTCSLNQTCTAVNSMCVNGYCCASTTTTTTNACCYQNSKYFFKQFLPAGLFSECFRLCWCKLWYLWV